MYLDTYAYNSKFKNIRPDEKIIFSLVTLIIALFNNSIVISILIGITLSSILLFINNTQIETYIKLIKIPLVFLLISVLTIAFEFSSDSSKLSHYISFGKYFIGITNKSIIRASILFFKSLACVISMYFLTLTTPLMDSLSFLRKCRVPKLFSELMSLIYRFIFIILDSVNEVYTAQNSRLGYINLKRSFTSMANLISSSLIKSLTKANYIYTSMESRLYDGDIVVIERDYEINTKLNFLFIMVDLFILILIIFNYILGGIII